MARALMDEDDSGVSEVEIIKAICLLQDEGKSGVTPAGTPEEEEATERGEEVPAVAMETGQ